MINFFSEYNFELISPSDYLNWIKRVVKYEHLMLGELNFIFCDDAYLLEINTKYLNHNTYTDIVTFNYNDGKIISGDIYISVERVKDNAKIFSQSFDTELLRVMAHGVLHLCGYNDKTEDEIKIMRAKEDSSIKMFHVEQ